MKLRISADATDQHGGRLMNTIWQDLRYGARMLRKPSGVS